MSVSESVSGIRSTPSMFVSRRRIFFSNSPSRVECVETRLSTEGPGRFRSPIPSPPCWVPLFAPLAAAEKVGISNLLMLPSVNLWIRFEVRRETLATPCLASGVSLWYILVDFSNAWFYILDYCPKYMIFVLTVFWWPPCRQFRGPFLPDCCLLRLLARSRDWASWRRWLASCLLFSLIWSNRSAVWIPSENLRFHFNLQKFQVLSLYF